MLAIGALDFSEPLAAFFLTQLPDFHEFPGAVRIGFGPIRVERRIWNLFVINEMSNGLLRPESEEFFNFVRWSTKAGAIQEMRGGGEIPFVARQCLKHT